MSKFIEKVMLNMLSLWVIDYFSSSVSFSGLGSLGVTALILTLLNATIRPLLQVLSLPFSILTLGLFSLVINGIVLWASFSISEGSYISSFGTAVLMAVVIAVLNTFYEKIFD